MRLWWMWARCALAACDDGAPERDDSARWNHGQARGTHNSTHIALEFPAHPSHHYTQRPLAVQLGEQGVRQIELDVHRHVDGHFEVLHLPIIDFLTVCQRLSTCLEELRTWSVSNPDHFPVMVWIEPKDDVDNAPPFERILPAHVDDLAAEDAYAAVSKINDAERGAERVARLTAGGFVVTSNVDGADEDDAANARRRDASLAAGAHFLSSDFPAPTPDRDYWLRVPGGVPVRCNPVSAPVDCAPEALE